MFADLLATPGVEEVAELRSAFGFMAFHGGSLERGTDEIALRAAEAAGASIYAVVQPEDVRWHIPSRLVGASASASPALQSFLAHVDVAVAIHGFGRDGRWRQILLGGSNRALASHLAGFIAPALPDIEVVDDVAEIPVDLRGLHPDNPVNLTRGGGVQVELPPRVRGLTPAAVSIDPLVEALAAAAAAWPPQPGPSGSTT